MASRRPPAPPSPHKVNLSPDQMRSGISRIERAIDKIEAFDPAILTQRRGPEQSALEASISGTLESVFGSGTIEYRRYERAAHLDRGPWNVDNPYVGGRIDRGAEARKYVAEGKAESVQLLREAINWLNEELEFAPPALAVLLADDAAELRASVVAKSRKIFIVHGHDEAALSTVARFVEQLEFEPIVLKEQVNQGRTIIEKIEANRDVGFAVVLLTPDDVGGKIGEPQMQRARQNVLLELGYFMAHLKRANICVLTPPVKMDIPSDFAGMIWEVLDGAGAWKMSLARELRAAGYAVDLNKTMG